MLAYITTFHRDTYGKENIRTNSLPELHGRQVQGLHLVELVLILAPNSADCEESTRGTKACVSSEDLVTFALPLFPGSAAPLETAIRLSLDHACPSYRSFTLYRGCVH